MWLDRNAAMPKYLLGQCAARMATDASSGFECADRVDSWGTNQTPKAGLGFYMDLLTM